MPASRRRPLIGELVWFHRWLGVATCLLFAMWFATGAVMLFKPFPSVSAPDRAALAAPLDLGAVRIGPGAALRAAGVTGGDLRLVQRAGSPAYIVRVDGPAIAIDAATATVLRPLPPAAMGAEAPPQDYDQWTVPNGLDPYRPLYRIPRRDAAGTIDYLSARTGELVQRTTAGDRMWNWAGSVLHWVYFTPLRADWALWDQTVWCLSLVASLVAIAGFLLGIVRSATAMKRARPTLSYFRAPWMRWHHLLGLFAGPFVLLWIVSGWLSMDHGRLFSDGTAAQEQAHAFVGDADLSAITPATLRSLGPAKQIQFSGLGGEVILAVMRPGGAVERLDAAGNTLTERGFGRMLGQGVASAWPGARLTSLSDVAPADLYRNNEGWPDSVKRARLSGAARPDLYVDGTNGRLLTVMDGSREAYAWAYYGIHTFKFPGLAERPVLRKTLVLCLLFAGFACSLTGSVIGWRRLRRRTLRGAN